ncbi:hypothetical protein M6B38_348080 [Iris pallida]|uniref:NADH dehydrogenase subunit 1 n=1 Tax=Iris pallida TaxID=29817 RepID=A0AAX6GT66_IRIPA|nr:hypothetical protein M6B38_348080 [Iris pallida]
MEHDVIALDIAALFHLFSLEIVYFMISLLYILFDRICLRMILY